MAAPGTPDPNLPPLGDAKPAASGSRLTIVGMTMLMIVWFVYCTIIAPQPTPDDGNENAGNAAADADNANQAGDSNEPTQTLPSALTQTQPGLLQDVFDQVAGIDRNAADANANNAGNAAADNNASGDASNASTGDGATMSPAGEVPDDEAWLIPTAVASDVRLEFAPLGRDFAEVADKRAEASVPTEGEPAESEAAALPRLQFVFSNIGATVAAAYVLDFPSTGRDHRDGEHLMSYTELILPYVPDHGAFGIGLVIDGFEGESRYLDTVEWELVSRTSERIEVPAGSPYVVVPGVDAGETETKSVDVTRLVYRFPPVGTPPEQNPLGLSVEKTFTYRHDGHDLQCSVRFVNAGGADIKVNRLLLYNAVGLFGGYGPDDANQIIARVRLGDGNVQYLPTDFRELTGNLEKYARTQDRSISLDFSVLGKWRYPADVTRFAYGGQAMRYFEVVTREPGVRLLELGGGGASSPAPVGEGGEPVQLLGVTDVIARPFDVVLPLDSGAGVAYMGVALLGAVKALPGSAHDGVITLGTGEDAAAFLIDRFRYDVDYADGVRTLPKRHLVETAVVIQGFTLTAGGGQQDVTTTTFLGPRGIELLTAGGLADSIRYASAMEEIAKPLLTVIRFFYDWLGNYGIAIMLLTICVRVVLLPLSYKAQYSMQETAVKMKKFQPKIQKLREKFGDDKQRLNQETMKLYQKEGIPMTGMLKGCFIMLLQMPIWIALYSSFRYSIDLVNKPFLWINDLSKPDAVLTITTDFKLPWFFEMISTNMAPSGVLHLNILPLVVIVLMYAQAKLSQTMQSATMSPDQAKQQRFMMGCMYIFFFFIFYGMAAGFNLYFLASSIYGLAEARFVRSRIRARVEAKEGYVPEEVAAAAGEKPAKSPREKKPLPRTPKKR